MVTSAVNPSSLLSLCLWPSPWGGGGHTSSALSGRGVRQHEAPTGPSLSGSAGGGSVERGNRFMSTSPASEEDYESCAPLWPSLIMKVMFLACACLDPRVKVMLRGCGPGEFIHGPTSTIHLNGGAMNMHVHAHTCVCVRACACACVCVCVPTTETEDRLGP